MSAGQFPQNHRRVGVFGMLDRAFGHALIHPRLKARLTARPPFELAFGTAGLPGCVAAPEPGFNRIPSVGVAVGVGRQVVDPTQVHADETPGQGRRSFGPVNSGEQVKPAIAVDPSALAFETRPRVSLAVTVNHGDNLTPLKGEQAEVSRSLLAFA